MFKPYFTLVEGISFDRLFFSSHHLPSTPLKSNMKTTLAFIFALAALAEAYTPTNAEQFKRHLPPLRIPSRLLHRSAACKSSHKAPIYALTDKPLLQLGRIQLYNDVNHLLQA